MSAILSPPRLTLRATPLLCTLLLAALLTFLNFAPPIHAVSAAATEHDIYTSNLLRVDPLTPRDYLSAQGPLAFLADTRAVSSELAAYSFYSWLALTVLLNMSLLLLARLSASSEKQYLLNILLAITVAIGAISAGQQGVIALLGVSLLFLQTQRSVWLVLACALCSVFVLANGQTLLPCVALLLGISSCASVARRSLRPLLTTLIAPVIFCALWLTVTDSTLSAALHYVAANLHIHTSAATLSALPSTTWISLLALFTLAALIIRQGINGKSPASRVLLFSFVVLNFLLFKSTLLHSSVEQSIIALSCIAFLGMLLAMSLPPQAKAWLIGLIALYAMCLFKSHSLPTPVVFSHINQLSIEQRFNPYSLYHAVQQGDQQQLQSHQLGNELRRTIADSSVAIFPESGVVAHANYLHWQPLPAPTALASSERADAINAAFLADADAPSFLIWRNDSLQQQNNYYFLNTHPLTISAIFRHYQQQRCDAASCIWQRSKPTDDQLISSESFAIKPNQRIKTPAGDALKLKLDLEFNTLGALVSWLIKPPLVTIEYVFNDKTTKLARVQRISAQHGLWVRPHLKAPTATATDQDVVAINIQVNPRFIKTISGQWQSSEKLRLNHTGHKPADSRPNFLFIITDDQSWEHTSKAGERAIQTPNFDQIANQGLYFSNAYVSAPSCTGSRAAVITGRPFWQLQNASQLWGEFDSKALRSYQHILGENGYRTGYTGKGWGPGKQTNGDPLGQPYNKYKLNVHPTLTQQDLVKNFTDFLSSTDLNQPFSFWIGPTEPHRPFKGGSGSPDLIDHSHIRLPAFLPDHPDIRQDIADYLFEIQWFDKQLGEILELLKKKGVYENTVIVYTSDNGMPFPRSKATLYQHGTRVPLAIQWGSKKYDVHGQRFVNLIDIAPTFLELAGIAQPAVMPGHSLAKILRHQPDSNIPSYTVSGRERHIPNARANNIGYPARAIYQQDYVYIYNFKPERTPAGDAPNYEDIDNTSASKLTLLHDPSPAVALARDTIFKQAPQEELYYLPNDPDQLHNLATEAKYIDKKNELRKLLFDYLKRMNDPRLSKQGDAFDQIPSYMP